MIQTQVLPVERRMQQPLDHEYPFLPSYASGPSDWAGIEPHHWQCSKLGGPARDGYTRSKGSSGSLGCTGSRGSSGSGGYSGSRWCCTGSESYTRSLCYPVSKSSSVKAGPNRRRRFSSPAADAKFHPQRVDGSDVTGMEMSARSRTVSAPVLPELSCLCTSKVEKANNGRCFSNVEKLSSKLCSSNVEKANSGLCSSNVKKPSSKLCSSNVEKANSRLCSSNVEKANNGLFSSNVKKANSHLPSSEYELCSSHVENSNGLNSLCVKVNCGLCSSSDEKATGGPCSLEVEKASTGGPCSPVFNREYGGPHLNLLPSSPSHLTQALKSPGGQNYLSIGLQIPKSASTAFTRAFTGKTQ
jgi:hypothetical protein